MTRRLATTGALILLGACRSPSAAPSQIRVALPAELQTLDPHVSNTSAAFTVLGNVYQALVVTDPGLGRRPSLATRWHNPDPLTWDFDLDPQARFHDGKALEPADVVFSLSRVLSEPDLDLRYYLGDVARAEISGPLSVRVRLKRRSPVLLHKLGHVFIVPAGSSRSSLDRRPRGTGAYRVLSWRAGHSLELQAAEGTRGQPPPVPRARLQVNLAPDEIAKSLADGGTDMALLGSSRTAAQLEATQFDLHRRGSLQVKYLGFDVERTTLSGGANPNPFHDRRVREAIHLAIDRAALAAGLGADALPASQLVPRHVFGFDSSLPLVAQDPEGSRTRLREAGYQGGLKAKLHTREILRDAALALVAQLRAVGVELEPVIQPDPEYFEVLRRREASVWLDRWACTTGDSGEMFENAFHSPDPVRGLGEFNESGLRDGGLDESIEEALAVDDLPRRRAALAGLMRQVMAELVWIPLYTDEEVWAVRRPFKWQPRSEYWLQLAEVAPVSAQR